MAWLPAGEGARRRTRLEIHGLERYRLCFLRVTCRRVGITGILRECLRLRQSHDLEHLAPTSDWGLELRFGRR